MIYDALRNWHSKATFSDSRAQNIIPSAYTKLQHAAASRCAYQANSQLYNCLKVHRSRSIASAYIDFRILRHVLWVQLYWGSTRVITMFYWARNQLSFFSFFLKKQVACSTIIWTKARCGRFSLIIWSPVDFLNDFGQR